MVSEIRMEIRMEAPSGVRGKSVSFGVKQVNQSINVIARSVSDEAIQGNMHLALDCFVEPVIGTRDFARSRWLAMTGELLIMTIFTVPDRRRHRLILRPRRIEIAEAAIAGDHRRLALLRTPEFAVPDHLAGAEALHRAPRRVADRAGTAWRCEKQQHTAECSRGQQY